MEVIEELTDAMSPNTIQAGVEGNYFVHFTIVLHNLTI